jgi:predicted Fe-S protein YdhL (DUF1289 family)
VTLSEIPAVAAAVVAATVVADKPVIDIPVALAQRAAQVAAEGGFAEDFNGVVTSPCISVCRMTPDRSHCQGCFRTLDELRAWGKVDAAQRRAIWAQLLVRAGIAHPAAAAPVSD